MIVKETYYLADRREEQANGLTPLLSNMTNLRKVNGWYFRLIAEAENAGIVGVNERKKLERGENFWKIDAEFIDKDGLGRKKTEYLEFKNGFIIREVLETETLEEMQARWDREYKERNKEN